MPTDTRTLRPFLIACSALWVVVIIAAFVYLRMHPADPWILKAVLPACLIEGCFYLGATMAGPREFLKTIGSPRTQAALLWMSALIPYLVFSTIAGIYSSHAFSLLLLLTGVFSFWQVVLPRRWIYDAGFLVVAAAPIVSRVFKRIYVTPDPAISLDIIGHLMWLRVGIVAMLVLRKWQPGDFGLWPTSREWKIGTAYYLASILPICFLALAVHDVRFSPLARPPVVVAGVAIGTFFGILWVVAAGEELLFRGVIARALLHATGSNVYSIIVSAALFGSAHLWYHAFPNWRRALVASLLGVFCGAAYIRTNSVRVPMVAHALVVTTWRVLFIG